MIARLYLRDKQHRLLIVEANQERSSPERKISGKYEEFIGSPGNPCG
jgi:hypothetical protein